MASTDATQTQQGAPRASGSRQLPTFRRATPQDALDFAQASFLAEERVDMGTLAAQLAISRATLYRWFTSRDELLERMLVQLAHEFSKAAHVDLDVAGDERVIEFARRLMNATVDFPPLRKFVDREPQLALRLLIGQNGAIHTVIAQALLGVIGETRSSEEAAALVDNVDVVVWVATTLQWATLAGGEEPQTERAVEVMRALLAAHPAS
jgi:AcrR family transcriptional regulator